MSHILVKWPRVKKWDVYSIRAIEDVELGKRLAACPNDVREIKEQKVAINWKEGTKPSLAYILAVGSEGTMEKKRSKIVREQDLASDEEENEPGGENEPCCTHLTELETLREENKELTEKLRKAEEAADSAKMVNRLKKIMETDTKHGQPSTIVAEPQVDIGGGVLVGSHHLSYLKSRCAGQPTKFARALLRVLFSEEELKGKSLFGVVSNAHKEKEPKQGLDRTRVNALIAYTMTTFNLQDDAKVKNSLSSMLVRNK